MEWERRPNSIWRACTYTSRNPRVFSFIFECITDFSFFFFFFIPVHCRCAVLYCVGSALLQVHASLLPPTFSRGKKRVRFARESTTLLFHHKQLDLYRHVVCVYTHSRFSPTPAAGNRRNNKIATRESCWLARQFRYTSLRSLTLRPLLLMCV
jgi:hypothetical protein